MAQASELKNCEILLRFTSSGQFETKQNAYNVLSDSGLLKTHEFNSALYLALRRRNMSLNLRGFNNRKARASDEIRLFGTKLNALIENWSSHQTEFMSETLDAYDDLLKDAALLRQVQLRLLIYEVRSSALAQTAFIEELSMALHDTLTQTNQFIDQPLELQSPPISKSIFKIQHRKLADVQFITFFLACSLEDLNSLSQFEITFLGHIDLIDAWLSLDEIKFLVSKFEQNIKNFQIEFKDFLSSNQEFEDLRTKAFLLLQEYSHAGHLDHVLLNKIKSTQHHMQKLKNKIETSPHLQSDQIRALNQSLSLAETELQQVIKNQNLIFSNLTQFYSLFRQLDRAHMRSPKPFRFSHEEILVLLNLIKEPLHTNRFLLTFKNSTRTRPEDLKPSELELERLYLLRTEIEDLVEIAQEYDRETEPEDREYLMTEYFDAQFSKEYLPAFLKLFEVNTISMDFKKDLYSRITTHHQQDHELVLAFQIGAQQLGWTR